MSENPVIMRVWSVLVYILAGCGVTCLPVALVFGICAAAVLFWIAVGVSLLLFVWQTGIVIGAARSLISVKFGQYINIAIVYIVIIII